jgi:hypothetical protein
MLLFIVSMLFAVTTFFYLSIKSAITEPKEPRLMRE